MKTGVDAKIAKRSAILILLTIACLAACSVPQVQKTDVRAIDAYPLRKEMNGLTVAIDPQQNPAIVKTTFGVNLLEERILPIFVVIRNDNPLASFLVSADQFVLQQGNVTASTGGASISTTSAEVLVYLFGAIFAQRVTDLKFANQNMRHVELARTTLSPGRVASGYIYFQLPSDTPPSATWAIAYSSQIIGSDISTSMRIPLTLVQRQGD